MSVEQLEVTAASAPDDWIFGSHAPGEKVAAVAVAGDGSYIGGRAMDAAEPVEQRFALADATAFGDGDTITEVRIVASLQDNLEGGSAGQFKSRLILGGSISDSAWTNSALHPWANFSPYSAAFTEKPGGGAWTKADVDALEVGVVAHSPDSDISRWHIERLYVEVEYTVVPVEVNETDSGAGADFGAVVDTLDPDEEVAGSLWLPQGAAASNLDGVLRPHDDDEKYTRSPPSAFRYLLFKLEPHALGALRLIEAVTLHARVRSPSGGAADFIMTVGGVELTQGASVGGAAWKNVSWRRALAPNGDPWQHADLDALEFGLVTGDSNEDPVHCTTLYVEVETTQLIPTLIDGGDDAAAGAEAHALGVGTDEAAAGGEAVTVAAELASADAGAAADAHALTVAAADEAAAGDGAQVAAELAGADSGAAFDSHALAASVAFAEAGDAQDSHALAASVGEADAAAGADDHALASAVPAGDAAAAVEVAAVALAFGEDAAGADAGSVAASLAAAEIGAGADAENLAASVAFADAGAGEDAAALAAAVAFAEAAAAIEIAAVALAFGEAAAAADGSLVALAFGDEAAAADSAALALALADSCAASESVRRIVRSRRGRAFAVILSGTKARG